LLGDAQFTAPMAKEDEHRVYDSLIQVRPNGKLNITGSGSLTFHGNAVGWPTAAVAVEEDGVLSIESGTVRGDTGNRTSFCYAVNVNGGTLYVYDGTLIGTNRYDQSPISAVNLYDGVAYIHGGTFQSRVFDGAVGSKYYGLSISEGAAAHISGGVFKGISLPNSTQSHTYRMSDYVENGYVMTIDGSKATPSLYHTISGSTVEVYKEISAVNIHVNSPAAGKAPATTPEEVYLVPEGATVKSITWYENGELWSDINFGSARFEPGNTYSVEIVLVADNNVKFADPLTSATINYKKAAVNAHAGNREKAIVLTADLGECAATISEVHLTVTAPKEGEKPSYTVGLGSEAYKPVGNYNNYKDYRQWYMSSDGDEWWVINENQTFISGYYYKFVVDIQTASGYEFAVYDDGTSIQPNVSATVNGYYAKVIKAYEQDPSTYITVEYNFGECNDSIVEQVAIVDVTAPVAGQRPNYTYNILGTGYQMNTDKNAYKDIYWTNPTEKWYYIKNGIGWFDVTEEDWVYEHETFIPGHEYEVNVYLFAEDGYEFAHDKWYNMQITATVNGQTAEFKNTGSDCAWYQQIEYTFTCAQPKVDTLLLYDLDAPQAGKTPDTEVTAAYPEFYEVSAVRWLDEEDNEVNAFEQGRLYTAEITVAAKDYDGTDGCIFADAMTAYIDGTKVSGWNNSVTKNNDNTVTIRYSFRKGAAAPAAPSVSSVWEGDSCTVTLESFEEGVSVMAASYENGRMTEVTYLTIIAPSASLSGDTVQVFFLNTVNDTPICEATELHP
ncbi:MAG: hypothetical protein IKU27_05840, partial [Clostridia bacterium]|nr:hypothetical protein [Clostridia bacterium]